MQDFWEVSFKEREHALLFPPPFPHLTWSKVATATDTILDNEVILGMEATSRGWWSGKIGMQVPDDSMEVPSQPPTAVYVRENQSQTQSSLQQQSTEHARH